VAHTQQVRNLDKPSGKTEADWRSPYLLWLIWVIWVPFFSPGFIRFFQSHPSPLLIVVALAGVVLFFALYLWSTLDNTRRVVATTSRGDERDLRQWLPLLGMVVLSVLLPFFSPNDPSDWFDFFILTSGYVGGRFSTRGALPLIAGLVLLNVALGWFMDIDWTIVGKSVVFVFVVGIVSNGLMQAILTGLELRAAREEIARLAVTNERLRIARDLHDLLGHNLSLITLKSELAGRLLSRAPQRAAIEISDIEQVARTTLQEVREAVASYRQPTLASELQGVRELLAAAGIAYQYEGDEREYESLPTVLESVLAWAVREGITNVVKHSRAQHCWLRLTRDTQSITLEVENDGLPVATASTGNIPRGNGNGLRGLIERATVLGGECVSGPRAEEGYCLVVSLPLDQKRSSRKQEERSSVQ
jgi:two-component system sensor histidine kinase DesK